VRDLAINLLASVLAGTAVWLGQRLVAYRRLARERTFFGLAVGGTGKLVVGRHASSTRENSVHRADVAALVELAALVRECGATADLDGPNRLGDHTEFCVGGPTTNPRTEAHMRAMLPGVRIAPYDKRSGGLALTVGPHRFARRTDRLEYAAVARCRSGTGRPVFLLIGQTATANLAAARFLAGRHRALRRTYGADEDFCVVVRVVEPGAYGADRVELEADVTADATTPRSPASSVG
jgi:hypothetical protein